jgi:hypothetical protein
VINRFPRHRASLLLTPTVVSFPFEHASTLAKQGSSCQVWLLACSIAEMIAEGASPGESSSSFCPSGTNSLPLSHHCYASGSALPGGQMGREGPMDHLRALLCSHHYSRHFYHLFILQSAYSLGILNRFTNESLRDICIRPGVRGVSFCRWSL